MKIINEVEMNAVLESVFKKPLSDNSLQREFDKYIGNKHLYETVGGTTILEDILNSATYIRYSKRIIRRIKTSLYLTVICADVRVYGLTDEYTELIRMLYNKYLVAISIGLPFDATLRKQVIYKREKYRAEKRSDYVEQTYSNNFT